MNLPGPGISVEIEDAAGAVVPARVASTVLRGLVVEWTGGLAADNGPVIARWGSDRGLMVAACELLGEGRYGHLTVSSDPQQVQRREAVRVELRVPVHRIVAGRRVETLGETVNVSATGLLVAGRLSMPIGTEFALGLDLPDRPHEPFNATGTVRRAVEPAMFGLELLGLTPGQQDRLVRLVFERQREELRRRRTRAGALHLVRES